MASNCPNITEVSALQANSNNIVRSAQHGNSSTLNIPLSSLLSTSVIVLVTVSQLFFKCQHPFFFFFNTDFRPSYRTWTRDSETICEEALTSPDSCYSLVHTVPFTFVATDLPWEMMFNCLPAVISCHFIQSVCPRVSHGDTFMTNFWQVNEWPYNDCHGYIYLSI